ncbi:hypothetical protein [Vreelandella neptunia]|uniref:Uncharacterized protein n=1 Tax=Vreelandella neptunia TaxID=115551 RepID=A0ABZ0YRG3_9GAMM|nr:hypothetical protein [Halomonas neptunia]MDN3561684.1 hypothetical protein [Halomonas neptunia]WQH14586.1 hypothetical protein SR894_08615 [Halomonas neptunia]
MEETAPRARELKGQDLDNYIEAKNITRICPSCGENDIMILSHGPDEPLHIMDMKLSHSTASPDSVVQVAAFVCQNCGNLRTFSKKWILAWIEEESHSVE